MNLTMKTLVICPFLLVVIILGTPMMFLTDEWITGNQVHQLDQQHQILIAEGKYGFFENGTPYPYFSERGNILPYTTYLPLMAYPSLQIVKNGDGMVPFFMSGICSILFILLGLLLQRVSSEKGKREMGRIVVFLSIPFFFFNLIFYHPGVIHPEASPIEILGVGIFHLLILLGLIWIISLICDLLFQDELYSLFSTVVCICCSSYLFWSMTLKDHIDSVFFVSLIMYTLLMFRKTNDYWFFPVSFMLCGLLTWIRPEYGFFIFIVVLGIFVITLVSDTRRERSMGTFGFALLSPFFSILGAIPLIIGNALTTGHPWTLAWQLVPDSSSGSAIPAETTPLIISETIMNRITPHTDSLFRDVFGFLIAPESLKMPLLSLTPVFLLGLFILPFVYFYLKKRLEREEWIIIIILLSTSFATILAYATSITGLGTSIGVYPDVRYLSPVYLPLNLIGLMIIHKLPRDFFPGHVLLHSISCLSLIGIPLVVMIQVFSHSGLDFWDFFLVFNGITPVLVYAMTGVTFVMVAMRLMGFISGRFLIIPFSLCIVIPFLWQISLLCLGNFYPEAFTSNGPLLPGMREVFRILSHIGW